MEVPAGSQNGDVIQLKGKGLPSLQTGKAGNQHVILYIEVPRKLSPEQRELLEKLAQLEQANITPERKSFFDRVKECFSGKDRNMDKSNS